MPDGEASVLGYGDCGISRHYHFSYYPPVIELYYLLVIIQIDLFSKLFEFEVTLRKKIKSKETTKKSIYYRLKNMIRDSVED